jgi:ubiquinone biosynthesis protein
LIAKRAPVFDFSIERLLILLNKGVEPMWLEALGAAQDLGRLQDIASVLIRYGFADVVQRIGMVEVLARAGKVLHLTRMEETLHMSAPIRMRRALEDLGPSFVKLGQLLATRVDLFSPEWIRELELLQDHAPQVTYDGIRLVIQQNLGSQPEQLFAKFDTRPLAAGSIAQVHRAQLFDGSDVVVKVRRPGIRETIDADMRLLQRLAKIIENESLEWRRFRPLDVVRRFKMSLYRELDLAAECRNAERIAKAFSHQANIVVPKVYWQFTGEDINVQDFINGIPAHDYDAIDNAGLDKAMLARIGTQTALKMMLQDGFFHADPHPGNIFYLPGNKVALIDYGMVGHLSEKRRDQVIDLLHALVQRNSEQVIEVLLQWTDEAQVDNEKLSSDVDNFLDQYHGVALKQLNLSQMLADMTVVLRDNQLALPPDLAMLIKVFVILESMGRKLDPDFDMVAQAAPYIPNASYRRSRRAVLAAWGMLSSLPETLRIILRHARTGKLKISLDLARLEHLGDQLDHSANRLTIGIVIAALIIGSSIVMTVKGGPTLLGLPVFGLLGFIGAVMGSLWLLYSIWRSGGGR